MSRLTIKIGNAETARRPSVPRMRSTEFLGLVIKSRFLSSNLPPPAHNSFGISNVTHG